MALKSVDTEGAFRNSGVAPANGDYTCLFWYKPREATGAGVGRVLFLQVNGIATYTQWAAIWSLGPANDIFLSIEDGSGSVTTSTLAIHNTKPVAIAYVRSGNNHSFYADGVLIGTVVVDITAITFTEQYIVSDTFPTVIGDSEVQGFREWNSALTLAELITEWNSPTVVKASPWADIPLTSNLNDISGNARNLTAIGAPTFVDSAIQVPQTNTSGAASVVLALDTDYVQVAITAAGGNPSLAFKYTGVAGEAIFAVWFPWSSIYKPTINVYSDESWSTIWKFIQNNRVAQEIPITEAVTLWLRFVPNAGNPAGSLFLRTYSFTQQNAVAGDLLIEDAVSEWPAVIISPVDGTVLQVRSPFSGGDDGFKLSSGRYIYEDREFVDSRLYDENLNLVASGLPYTTRLLTGIKDGNQFYIGQLGAGVDSTIEVYDTDGVFQESLNLGIQSSLDQISVGSPTPGVADIAYVVLNSVIGTIKRYDKVAGVFISDLAAGVATYETLEMLWLYGNTLLAVYFKSGDAFIRRYDCVSGAILNTYPIPDNFNTQIHLSDPFPNIITPQVNFWLWHKLDVNRSRFMDIRVADGVVLSTFDREHTFNSGEFPNATEDSPKIAHSASCVVQTLTEDIPIASNGTLIVIKQTIPNGLPDEFVIDVGGGLTPTQITLADGQSHQYNDVAAGTYSVIEEPQSGFTTTYEVSNGDPNDAIEIGEGETVTVTITNRQLGGIQVQKVTSVPSGTLFDFITSGLIPTNFQISSGQTIDFEDLDPSLTYSVEEVNLPAGWVLLSAVTSNGSPVSAIVVDPGAVTIVVITNQFTANEASGIYKIEPGKTDDTLWVDITPPGVTFRRKIPDPTAKTALLGD